MRFMNKAPGMKSGEPRIPYQHISAQRRGNKDRQAVLSVTSRQSKMLRTKYLVLAGNDVGLREEATHHRSLRRPLCSLEVPPHNYRPNQ